MKIVIKHDHRCRLVAIKPTGDDECSLHAVTSEAAKEVLDYVSGLTGGDATELAGLIALAAVARHRTTVEAHNEED